MTDRDPLARLGTPACLAFPFRSFFAEQSGIRTTWLEHSTCTVSWEVSLWSSSIEASSGKTRSLNNRSGEKRPFTIRMKDLTGSEIVAS